ncbi:microcystin degradation protein MlrC [Xylophilus rhododendri]|uniref:Microcystin degradation protein MlrC n=1 Tax=Xylophilus rhododendri TaxID=2697032 RepID=A0A857J3A2_9BURK|nr:M81 family metallopeptidase [Xylophilus rhododendri]QHI97733.1 microcystin degradation protein MlrC [Xylophilus rhododendri]
MSDLPHQTATGRAPRVLVGQIFQEAHGFTPLRTPLEAFAIERGEEVIAQNLQADSVLGGILRTGVAAGWELVPSIAARASPGGRVTDAAYDHILSALLQAARSGPLDAIALCLHGCIQTESLDSAEADLLHRLREIVGPRVPIVAGFDLHGHAGGGMLEYLDFASAYKTNPHGDAAATGERVATVLAGMLKGELRPVGMQVLVPMLTGGNDETGSGPLLRLHTLARERVAADPRLLDASIFNVNPFIDGAGVGQTLLVYATGAEGRDSAAALAETLAEGIWSARAEFTHALPTLEEVLAQARGRVVLGDFGDRVLAGAPGDSLFLARQVLARHPALRVVAPVTDPAALMLCQQAGAGAQVTLPVGWSITRAEAPLQLEGTVLATGVGVYRNRGAFMRGATLQVGEYAVLQAGRATLLITRNPLMSQDPGCFLDLGIDLDGADVIVVKSGYHFKLAFGDWGDCVCIATPGLTVFDPTTLDLQKARPLYPLDAPEFHARAVPARSTQFDFTTGRQDFGNAYEQSGG